jgi:hypothetical protein
VAELLTETSVKEEGRRRPKRSYPWRSSAPLVDAGLAALRHHAVDLPLLASSADAPPPCGSGELQGRPEDGYHATTGNLRVRSRRGHWTGLSRSLRRGAEGERARSAAAPILHVALQTRARGLFLYASLCETRVRVHRKARRCEAPDPVRRCAEQLDCAARRRRGHRQSGGQLHPIISVVSADVSADLEKGRRRGAAC